MAYAKSEETKERLLRAMARLLRVQGYNATGISQILKESGVPKGSLYHHYPEGKTELAAAAVDMSNKRIMAYLNDLVAAVQDPIKTVEVFCHYYMQQLNESGYMKGCPIATVALETAATVDPIQLACQKAFEEMTMLFTTQLETHGVEPETAAELGMVAVCSIEGALILCRSNRNTRPLEIVRDNIIRQLEAVL